MGLGIGMSSCKCDSHGASPSVRIIERNTNVPVYIDRNPNPRNFQIQRIEKYKEFLITVVKYPDCTNYEGVKIMVFKNVSEDQLKNAISLDPHFCDNKLCISPIARFEPTQIGWNMAVSFVRGWA